MVRPRVGVTSGTDDPGWSEGGPLWAPYARAVERAGGIPVHLGPGTLSREAAILEGLQAMLFTGGKDVDLSCYPNPPDYPAESPASVMERFHMEPEPERDRYEIPLVQCAIERDMPVLGICHGSQVLAVALGGRLILDIALETGTPLRHPAFPPPDRVSSRHALRIVPESRLATVLSPDRFTVCNSRHHQAVRLEPTMPVEVSAISPDDGIIEAIEVPGRRWAFGVQWHPEHSKDDDIRELYAPLFDAFVRACP